jgi:hypothetical protein
MYRDINQVEQIWIDKLLSVEFRGKEIIKKQISTAKVIYEKNFAFISLKFIVDKCRRSESQTNRWANYKW